MNKYVLAFFALAVSLVVGVAPALGNGTLTIGVVAAALSTALLTGLFKLVDPGIVVGIPTFVTAVVLALAAVTPDFQAAISDGNLSQAELLSLGMAFLNALWAKWSQPNHALKFGRG